MDVGRKAVLNFLYCLSYRSPVLARNDQTIKSKATATTRMGPAAYRLALAFWANRIFDKFNFQKTSTANITAKLTAGNAPLRKKQV